LIECIEAGEEFVGEVGDLEEPLAQLALLDERARPPAAAVDHLFVGEHGHVDRVPIDRGFLAVDQPGGEEIEEQRLFVAVIVGLASSEFAAPVEREAEALQLRLHRRDVGAGPGAGMDALFHRRVLGGHAERVPPHRVQHLVAAHPPIAREHVAHRVVADMPHVDAPRRIGEHLQHVALRFAAVVLGFERPGFIPDLLPGGIRLERVEARCHRDLIRRWRRGGDRGPW
jgi:hypothetical protein